MEYHRIRNKTFVCICVLWASLNAQSGGTHTTTTRDTMFQQTRSGIDTLITYAAKDSIVYSLKTRFMYLYTACEMRYQSIHLQSERIDVNWDTSTLTSYGIRDTVKQDSVIGKPILRDGDDTYYGDKIDYNFRTQKGRILVAHTQMDNGYYVGQTIKKVAKDELFIANGRFTTCDNPTPHFYFESPKMKVFVRDVVVAEPVYLYVANVPVFGLPFGIFPSHGGRASGVIAPAYGQDHDYGWYLSHIGYYWAASDYWDIATMFDIYARGKWMNQTQVNYALRDVLGGSLTTRITSMKKGESTDPDHRTQRDYYANLTHNQVISPTSRVDVNFTFASSTYFKNYSTNINEILSQNIISNATYSTYWPASNRSLSISIYRDQNLITDDVHEQLPSISFTQNQLYPFKSRKATRGLREESSQTQSFADLFGINYSASFTNDRWKQSTLYDSAYTPAGWRHNVKEFSNISKLTFNQSASMGVAPKVGYFTVSPSISWSESRQYLYGSYPRDIDSVIVHRDTTQWETSGIINTGVGISTRFYGIAQPNVFGITTFRHTVTPSLSLSYNKKIYGATIPKYQMLASVNIGNLFEMKTTSTDSTKPENKYQLLNVGLSTSYNFAADSMKFNDINVSYRTDIASLFSLSGSATYSLYEFDPRANRGYGARVNRYLLSTQKRFADLTRFSITFSTTLRGERKQREQPPGTPPLSVLEEQERVSGTPQFRQTQRLYETLYDIEEADFSIPWQLDFSYSFSQSQSDPRKKYRTSSANIGISFNLTEKWKISARGSYDFVKKQHYIQSLNVTRDLHCWQMNFTYYPMGTLAGFRFELRVAAPQLQDIKITKQSTRPY
ncbi:MAG: putative LPS assembly protein LptD [Bacteroidetes bacterium]|nr:putative LPS assembly protein LptD [Bacteroidota bacterium]